MAGSNDNCLTFQGTSRRSQSGCAIYSSPAMREGSAPVFSAYHVSLLLLSEFQTSFRFSCVLYKADLADFKKQFEHLCLLAGEFSNWFTVIVITDILELILSFCVPYCFIVTSFFFLF